ncbi:hypothetical protein [Franzmannia qiaohouensis]|uniref:Uncharacterized protein n=1 Tax=Franzmannia qiaohouensis TaxID=1329370 RepID=A0ABU1HJE5_9GAMM|nr:hypothetical protein [Halomonas qiaohouensis]MDR5907608.1 hypothetical protein [Halomonas qiaohouensis]
MKLLYEHEGLTNDLFRTFLIYIASSSRPAHELLNPNFIDIDQPYTLEFKGMTKIPASLDELLEIRTQLIADLRSRLDDDTKRFLLTLHDGNPDFAAIGRPQAAGLPAVRWKLVNLNKLKEQNTGKHMAQRKELESLF